MEHKPTLVLKEEEDPRWGGFTTRPESIEIGPYYEWVEDEDKFGRVWHARRKAHVKILNAWRLDEK